jgi:hypothetical protein
LEVRQGVVLHWASQEALSSLDRSSGSDGELRGLKLEKLTVSRMMSLAFREAPPAAVLREQGRSNVREAESGMT